MVVALASGKAERAFANFDRYEVVSVFCAIVFYDFYLALENVALTYDYPPQAAPAHLSRSEGFAVPKKNLPAARRDKRTGRHQS